MKIEKQLTIDAPRDAVWRFITDAARVAPCVPGCKSVVEKSPGIFSATIGLQIGPINTSFNVDIETKSLEPPSRAVYSMKGDEGGKASRAKAEIVLQLRELAAAQTELAYATDVTIVGRLGKFGAGIVQRKADAIGEEFAAALRKQMEAASGAPQDGQEGTTAEGRATADTSGVPTLVKALVGVAVALLATGLWMWLS